MIMPETQDRKLDHIRICLEKNVETSGTWLEDVILLHKALPEMNFDEIDTTTSFFGKKLNLPLMISSMTGGTEEAKEINKTLAGVAEKKGIAFGLGSQRAMIEDASKKETYYVRNVAPSVLLFGNIGISQVKQYKTEQIENALKSIGADLLSVHINAAQEIFQLDLEGDFDFSNSLISLSKLCKELKFPVIAKEVGNGISKECAMSLKDAGVKGIDVGGCGGTNWVVIEGMRSGKDTTNFRNWGISTACSILEAKPSGLPLIATGGIRSGSDIAKSIVLGASICGIALPFLKILKREGEKGVENYIDKLEKELKMTMFLTGSRIIEELKNAKYVLIGRVKDWVEQRNL